jgi:hypothetical protein
MKSTYNMSKVTWFFRLLVVVLVTSILTGDRKKPGEICARWLCFTIDAEMKNGLGQVISW